MATVTNFSSISVRKSIEREKKVERELTKCSIYICTSIFFLNKNNANLHNLMVLKKIHTQHIFFYLPATGRRGKV